MGGEIDQVGGDIAWAEARSALAWWIESGVDMPVQEEERDWLKPTPQRTPAKNPETSLPPNIVEPAHETLAEIQAWLSSSMQLPLAAATAKRIPPHGPEDAVVMLLSDAHTVEDASAGQPISGEAWELTKRMLAAIRIPIEQAYSASLSCLHLPGARMSQADRDACTEIARKHIKLARPRRLLLLGDGPAKALLGKLVPQARGHVHKIQGVRTVATFHPRFLLQNAARKADAWKDLLLLMEDEA